MASSSLRQRPAACIPWLLDLSRPDALRSGEARALDHAHSVPCRSIACHVAGAGRRDLVPLRRPYALLEHRRRSAESRRGVRTRGIAVPGPAQPGPFLCGDAAKNLRPLADLQTNGATVDPLDVAPGRD